MDDCSYTYVYMHGCDRVQVAAGAIHILHVSIGYSSFVNTYTHDRIQT